MKAADKSFGFMIKIKYFILVFTAALLIIFSLKPAAFCSGQWPGVDESVVEKYAKEHGREAREPFINTDGDLLLFVFLFAGAAGGFIAGYYWRALITEKAYAVKRVEQKAKGL